LVLNFEQDSLCTIRDKNNGAELSNGADEPAFFMPSGKTKWNDFE